MARSSSAPGSVSAEAGQGLGRRRSRWVAGSGRGSEELRLSPVFRWAGSVSAEAGQGLVRSRRADTQSPGEISLSEPKPAQRSRFWSPRAEAWVGRLWDATPP